MQKTSIMQPYFLPYIGYWQMMNAVDTFMILDDVNYIRQGWIHRNRIECDGKEKSLVLPVRHVSSNVFIKDLHFVNDKQYIDDLQSTVRYAYRKAPYKNIGCALFKEIVEYPETAISLFLEHHMHVIADYLGIDTKIIKASDYRGPVHGKGINGVLELCHTLDTDVYINSIGGKHLYDKRRFEAENMELRFIRADFDAIEKISHRDHMDYSILDLIMNFSQEEIREMLNCVIYE